MEGQDPVPSNVAYTNLALTTSSSLLAADTASPAQNTWATVVSVAPTAGTYWFTVTESLVTAVNETVAIRIRDTTNGVSIASTGLFTQTGAGASESMTCSGVYVVPAGATIALQHISSAAVPSIVGKAALVANGTGNNATQINGLRTA